MVLRYVLYLVTNWECFALLWNIVLLFINIALLMCSQEVPVVPGWMVSVTYLELALSNLSCFLYNCMMC